MKKRVLLVYKSDSHQYGELNQKDSERVRRLANRIPAFISLKNADAMHQDSVKSILKKVKTFDVDYDTVSRARLKKVRKRYDLAVSIGGDGTFLQTARSVPSSVPILGVNSNPMRSEAVFSAATVENFEKLFQKALQGKLSGILIYRLKLTHNGVEIGQRPINDVLVAHPHPATMSRYVIKVGAQEEFQKSSGLWVATAAGSSSAVSAAGGKRLPWQVRQFQFRPRELYRGRLSKSKMTGNVLTARSKVEMTWLMRRGLACIDGQHINIKLKYADRLTFELSREDPVRVLGLKPRQ